MDDIELKLRNLKAVNGIGALLIHYKPYGGMKSGVRGFKYKVNKFLSRNGFIIFDTALYACPVIVEGDVCRVKQEFADAVIGGKMGAMCMYFPKELYGNLEWLLMGNEQ